MSNEQSEGLAVAARRLRALAWARALGEFGATLLFAGNLEGQTQTLTLAVYATFDSDMAAAQAISLVLLAFAFALLSVLTLKMRRRQMSERQDDAGA